MPRRVNGEQSPTAAHNPDFELTSKILSELGRHWVSQIEKNNDIDPVKFQRLGLVAFTQFAAILAVDAGAQEDQFSAICQAQFKAAYERAPKFG